MWDSMPYYLLFKLCSEDSYWFCDNLLSGIQQCRTFTDFHKQFNAFWLKRALQLLTLQFSHIFSNKSTRLEFSLLEKLRTQFMATHEKWFFLLSDLIVCLKDKNRIQSWAAATLSSCTHWVQDPLDNIWSITQSWFIYIHSVAIYSWILTSQIYRPKNDRTTMDVRKRKQKACPSEFF